MIGDWGKFFIVYLAVIVPIFYPLSDKIVNSIDPPGNLNDFIYILAVPINYFSVTSSSYAFTTICV